jgi:hypothetical protein
LALKLQLPALADHIEAVTVNGQPAAWHNMPSAVGRPMLEIICPPQARYVVEIQWQGQAPHPAAPELTVVSCGSFTRQFAPARIGQVLDPQQTLRQPQPDGTSLRAQVAGRPGSRTAFAQLRQGDLTWWEPVNLRVQSPPQPPAAALAAFTKWETVDLAAYYNDQVTRIFQNRYLAPRSPTATLELPTQGIGNWCYPLTQAPIDDSGLRHLAGIQNEVRPRTSYSCRSGTTIPTRLPCRSAAKPPEPCC